MLTEDFLEVLWDRDEGERETDSVPDWSPTARSPRPRLLVAEDDPEMCRLLVESLREDGYDVIEAENGRQLMTCIDALRRTVLHGRFFDVDMIISDIRMPGMTGLEMLSELRSCDQETPVILITAFGDVKTHAQAYRLGASAVFDKPFDLDGFRAFLKQLLPPQDEEEGTPPGLAG